MEPIIICQFEYVVWGEETTHYTCEMYSCYPHFVKPNTRIGAIQGIHLSGRSNEDVTAISMKTFNDEYVPHGLNAYFKNLEILEISETRLQKLAPRDLIGFEGLTELYITQTSLKYLPDNLFRNLRKLKRVSFSSCGSINNLEVVSSRLFKNLPKNQLEFIDLRGDRKLTDLVYDASNPKTMTFNKLMTKIDKKFISPVQGNDHQEQTRCSDSFAENFQKNFEKLWTTKDFSDFTIIVGEKEFLVHKNVLGSQNSFFSAMFKSDNEEMRTGRMTITDFSDEAVEEFLRHFYTAELPSILNAMEMFALAAKYDMPVLKEMCEDLISENIDQTNATEIFNMARLFDSEDIKTLSLLEIKRMKSKNKRAAEREEETEKEKQEPPAKKIRQSEIEN